MAVVTETKTFLPTGHDEVRTAYYSITNENRFIGNNADSTNYANIYLVRGESAETFYYATFDFSEIPENATITSVAARFKGRCTGAANYVKNKLVAGYIGDTRNGFSTTLTTADQVVTLQLSSGTVWTKEKLDDFTIRLSAMRTTAGTQNTYYFYAYGADVTVTYEYEDTPESPLYVKQNGIGWTPVTKAFRKQDGAWVESDDLTQVFENNKIYFKANE